MAAESKPETKAPAAPGAEPTPKKSKTWIIVPAIMIVEAIAVFVLAKMLVGGPAEASAAVEAASHDSHGGDEHESTGHAGPGSAGTDSHTEDAEVALTECKTINRESGKLILFHLRVSALVSASNLEKSKTLIQGKQARIDDRINTVIRSAEPRHLREPGLETIKRRMKYECDRIFEDESLVREILIPYLVQSGSGV